MVCVCVCRHQLQVGPYYPIPHGSSRNEKKWANVFDVVVCLLVPMYGHTAYRAYFAAYSKSHIQWIWQLVRLGGGGTLRRRSIPLVLNRGRREAKMIMTMLMATARMTLCVTP